MKGGGALFLAGASAIWAAGLAAALGTAVWTGGLGSGVLMVMVLAAIVALPHLLFLGLPAFFILGMRGPVRWWQAGLVGILVALPLPLFLQGVHPRAPGNPAEALAGLLWFCGSGLAGGLAFRAVYGAGNTRA